MVQSVLRNGETVILTLVLHLAAVDFALKAKSFDLDFCRFLKGKGA
jgi:hypothetical protein